LCDWGKIIDRKGKWFVGVRWSVTVGDLMMLWFLEWVGISCAHLVSGRFISCQSYNNGRKTKQATKSKIQKLHRKSPSTLATTIAATAIIVSAE